MYYMLVILIDNNVFRMLTNSFLLRNFFDITIKNRYENSIHLKKIQMYYYYLITYYNYIYFFKINNKYY